jgi:hypothetical protein
MEDNNNLSAAASAGDDKLHTEEREDASLNTSYSGESEPSTPEREPTATSIRRSTYVSDVDNDSEHHGIYAGNSTHGVLHAIDSTGERKPMHIWLGDIKLWTMAVEHVRMKYGCDTFEFTPFSSAQNWDKIHPELKIIGHAIQKGSTSPIKPFLRKQPSRDEDRFFDYFFSGSALSIIAKILLFSGAYYVMVVTFFLLEFLHNNGTLYGLEEGDNMRCVAAFGKEYGQYCTSFVAGLSNVGVLFYATLTNSYGFLMSTKDDIWQEEMIRRQLDPMKWDSFDYSDIHHFFSCTKLSSSPRPWWSEKQFKDVRDFYHEFAENDDTPFIGFITRSTYQATDEVYDISQNAIPYQTGTVKGRGLKASRDIRQGEMIIKTNNNTVVFNDAHTFRKFLFAISERFPDSGAGMVCDILIWAWPQDLDGGVTAAVVDLNNANLLNDWALESDEEDGNNSNEEGDSPNVKCRQLGKTISLECLASKDIMKGEELLANYGDFVSSSSSWEDWLL